MGSFVSKRPVRVTVEDRPDEYIEIRAKLGVGAAGDLTDSLLSVSGLGGDDAEVKLHAGKYTAALLRAGIVGWRIKGDPESGLPQDEEGCVPFKADFVDMLDEDDPLVDAALQEIVRRNPTLGRGRQRSANANG